MLAENPHKRYVSNVITPDQFSVNEVFIWPNKKKTYSNALHRDNSFAKKWKQTAYIWAEGYGAIRLNAVDVFRTFY